MKKTVVLVSALICSSNTLAIPSDFDFSGQFFADNDVALFDFTLESDQTVTLFTSSWGDDLGDGDGWVAGAGFDPILTIWDGSGVLVDEQDNGDIEGTTASNGVDYTYGVWDVFLDVALPAGDYFATLTQYDNFSIDTLLGNGFQRDDSPTFTFDDGFGSDPFFNGVWSADDPRSGDWAFHILNADAASQIPVGATWALFGIGLLGLFSTRRDVRENI